MEKGLTVNGTESKEGVLDLEELEAEADKLLEEGEKIRACELYKKIIEVDDKKAKIYYKLGQMFLEAQSRECIYYANKLIELEGDNDEYLIFAGRVELGTGALLSAYDLFEKAYELNNKNMNALNEMALVYMRNNETNSTLVQLSRVLDIDKAKSNDEKYIQLYEELTGIYHNLGKYEKAEEFGRYGLLIKKDSAILNGILGTVCQKLNKFDESILLLNRAVQIDPKNPSWHTNLGITYLQMMNVEKATECGEKALSLDSKFTSAWDLLGTVYYSLGDFKRAKDAFRIANHYSPENCRSSENLSYTYLSEKDFYNGFRNNICRFRNEQPFIVQILNDYVMINEDLNNKNICICTEQGLGDNLQFCRYLNTLQRKYPAVNIYLLSYPQMGKIFQYSFREKNINIIKYEELGNYSIDGATTLFNLMRDLRLTNEEIFEPMPNYLEIQPELKEYWGMVLGERKRPRVGVVWNARMASYLHNIRSIGYEEFKKIFSIGDVEFISLQIEYRDGDAQKLKVDGVRDLSGEIKDLVDTGAIMQNLDLVITVDSSVAHLAGGIGVPVWLLLSTGADWRWFRDREDSSIWYPTMRLFRQKEIFNWVPVMEKVYLELKEKYKI